MNREQSLGQVIILSGPSGVGKSTVFSHLICKELPLHFSVSCTTRERRPSEIDGRDYHFITEEQYKKHLAAGDFLEHAEVHGVLYGTLRSELDRTRENWDVLLDIDVQGHDQVVATLSQDPFFCKRIVSVFLMPPTFKELEKRLRGRNTETEEVIQRRLANAHKEVEAWKRYDYILINEDSCKTAENLEHIIRAAHFRSLHITQETWK